MLVEALSRRALVLPNELLRPLGLELRRVKSRSWRSDHPRFLYYRHLVDLIADVPGDIVECGVGRGRTLFMLGVLTQGKGQSRRLWGFDSFEGLPQPNPEDEADRFRPEKISAGRFACTESEVRALMSRYRILPDGRISRRELQERYVFVKGFFPEPLLKYTGSQIALLDLDVDLYQSYKDCLEYLEPKVAPGGIIAFDEYRTSTWTGATRAIEDYYGGPPPGIRRDERWGRWFLVKQ